MSKKSEELLYEYLESKIEDVMDKLKPKYKGKFALMSERSGGGKDYGSCNYGTNPPLITVKLGALVWQMEKSTEENIKKIISCNIALALRPIPRIENGIDNIPQYQKDVKEAESEFNFFE